MPVRQSRSGHLPKAGPLPQALAAAAARLHAGSPDGGIGVLAPTQPAPGPDAAHGGKDRRRRPLLKAPQPRGAHSSRQSARGLGDTVQDPPGRPAQGRLSLAVCPSGHTGSSISYPPLSSIFQECEQGNRERRACARAAADPSCSGGRGGVAGSGASPRSRGWVRGPPRPRGWVRGAAGSGASPRPRGGAEQVQNSSLSSPRTHAFLCDEYLFS